MNVSVLFNESKLLKFSREAGYVVTRPGFSTLQRVEIAEIDDLHVEIAMPLQFQYSSTSRNC